MLIFLLLWLARKQLLWLLWPVRVIVACPQTVIVACPCNIHVIGTCSCYCGLLPNGYCDLPVLLGPVHVIVACSQMVIVACSCICPCYCDLFMLLWLALEPVIVFLTLIYMKWLKIYYFTHFSSVVACSPWECCALCERLFIKLIVKWNEWNVGNE